MFLVKHLRKHFWKFWERKKLKIETFLELVALQRWEDEHSVLSLPSFLFDIWLNNFKSFLFNSFDLWNRFRVLSEESVWFFFEWTVERKVSMLATMAAATPTSTSPTPSDSTSVSDSAKSLLAGSWGPRQFIIVGWKTIKDIFSSEQVTNIIWYWGCTFVLEWSLYKWVILRNNLDRFWSGPEWAQETNDSNSVRLG
jgi:hypothetical protein